MGLEALGFEREGGANGRNLRGLRSAVRRVLCRGPYHLEEAHMDFLQRLYRNSVVCTTFKVHVFRLQGGINRRRLGEIIQYEDSTLTNEQK